MIARMFVSRILSAIVPLLGLSQVLHGERLETVLKESWRFQQGDPAGAETVEFKDSDWKAVDVPHAWSQAEPPSPRGPGWYRRMLEFPKVASGARTFLRFEAASLVADVYLNGTRLGQHRGGFTAFTYEITDAMKPGTNLLAVCVDNTNTGDVAPLSGDFTVFGGLYRPVHLITTGPLCISPLVNGSHGVRIRQSDVSHERATISVTTFFSNKSSGAKNHTLRISVLDAAGKSVARKESSMNANAASADEKLVIEKPHLWDSIADPYLYSVRVEVIADDKVIDSVTEPLGLRFFSFDKDKGFSLNGRACRLRGVCRHQDHGRNGWAVSKEDLEEDMTLIREIGANAVRLAHYPHSDDFLRLCDRYGIIAWSEIPLVDALGKAEGFEANATQQLEEMIAQLGNHPSILMWGLWNELQGGVPAQPIIQKLHDHAHALDPTRPTAAASFSGSERWCPDATKVTNLLATNTYPGWYRGTPEGMNDNLDKFRAFAPNQPLGVSEYGAGASIHQHQQGMTKAPMPRGPWHPEEWQAIAHEAHWKAIESRPFIWGSFIWNLFDFSSARRKEGDAPGINDKGLVTRDRKVKKDAFYFYKASWSPEPVVYITSRRDAVRTEASTPLKVYSSADHVKLTLNGKDLPPGEHEGVIHRWKEITLKKGSNEIVATAERDGKPVTDRVTWIFDPDAVVPKPE
jgi:beta-galactosidase